jgi:hypothetical protein
LATTTHTLATQRYSLPALWHLLSLDAPTVAVLWFLLAARCAHLHLHAADAAALGLGTWMFYAIDRMLDARLGAMHQQEERHRFHGSNQSTFLVALVCAVPVLLTLLAHMEPQLLHAYLELGVMLTGYFAAVHTRVLARQIPKELAVGVLFAAAIFMPEMLAGAVRTSLLTAVCFGGLCWLNCTAIYKREHGEREHADMRDAHRSTRFAVRHATLLLTAIAVAGVILSFSGGMAHALAYSVALSTLAMAALQRAQQRMGRLSYRIAADAALLTPVLFLLR